MIAPSVSTMITTTTQMSIDEMDESLTSTTHRHRKKPTRRRLPIELTPMALGIADDDLPGGYQKQPIIYN
jgi:hypothetical protein